MQDRSWIGPLLVRQPLQGGDRLRRPELVLEER
jgi:hypothetical protein